MLLESLSLFVTATLFGSMVFFSFVMAPLIFTQLTEATAGQFIRAVFPWYYLIVGALAAAACLLLLGSWTPGAALMACTAALAALARQSLMPRINQLRDLALDGDSVADRRFNVLHRLSVVINMLQLLLIAAVLASFTDLLANA